MSFRYLFGPVASRRFGRSLGIDLLGQRICSFDCVFCEAGPTQTCTMERGVYVPTDVVLAELRAWLGGGGVADVITLAGRGEPTLHTQFGMVIDAIHEMCVIPVVLLSNGSLFGMPDVRQSAARADIVKVSLSGWDDASMVNVNRPASGLTFDAYLEGMVSFREEFKGELRLEVMFVAGLNTSEDCVSKLAACAARIEADRIELNTVVRPPSVSGTDAVSEEMLHRYASFFGPKAVVIGRSAETVGLLDHAGDITPLSEQIMALLARRGGTLEEMALGIGAASARIQFCLQQLMDQGVVTPAAGRPDFYQLVTAEGSIYRTSKKSDEKQ